MTYARTEDECVGTRPACQDIVASTVVQCVRSIPTRDEIGSVAATEDLTRTALRDDLTSELAPRNSAYPIEGLGVRIRRIFVKLQAVPGVRDDDSLIG